MKDNYETRKSPYFSVINRKEKVCYEKPKELTKDQFDFYQKNGFLIIEKFYNTNEIKQAKKKCEQIFNKKTDVFINREPESNAVRSALSIHELPEFKSLVNDRIINISRSILGGKTYLHQSRINYKAGKNANGWNWHSDFETWHAKDGMSEINCLTAMVVIDKNTEENGCINFIPKSHMSFIGCPSIKDTDPNKEFSEQVEGVPSDKIIEMIKDRHKTETISAICKSGDLVLFDCNTLHNSSENTTDKKRTNLYFVINNINNRLVEPYCGGNHRPEEMACTNPIILN